MSVYFLMANGFEEAEAVVPADLLRRAGADVKLALVADNASGPAAVTGSHGVMLLTDMLADNIDVKTADAIVLPGGTAGTAVLAASLFLGALTLLYGVLVAWLLILAVYYTVRLM